MNEKTLNKLTLAFGIALLPPIWAVLSPLAGITTGAVALICAGLYVTNGNKVSDALKITIGFLCGDIWAVLAVFIMEKLSFNPNAELYCTLFVLGGIAVLIGETFPKFIFTPAWLCGWAIGLTIMGPMKISELGTLPIQIGAAMIAGVVYVGIGVDAFQKKLISIFKK
ncbi:DUF1097 domain-containing protein [Butyrivibrio sp. AE3004]|uniref:DUF1097 domain-containing protein n=1 Tax=Butyrivibrio sp. AE3004 TaxID=1506994 RepID=UPI000494C1BB|nr:DUF1097 domain-containing protein [Butyrivibrio sp. AE3004]